MSHPWMPLYVADYLADTSHLTTIEHGAYMLLIMHYWRNGGLPDDDAKLARIARASVEQWGAIRDTIADLFYDGWKHKRIDIELAVAEERHEVRVNAGKKGGETKASNAKAKLGNAVAKPYQSHSHSQSLNKKEIRAQAPPSDEKFEEFKKVYPKRKGANPWKPAKAQWDTALKSGSAADQILSALKAGTGFDRDKIGTEYIPQAVKWLRDRRFEDYQPSNVIAIDPNKFYAAFGSAELDAWDAYARKIKGLNMPRDSRGGWFCDARWPPGHESQTATG